MLTNTKHHMPRVVLLGDSIRIGYEPFVRAKLAQGAFVWGPVDNGQHTTNLLLNYWTWVAAQQPEVLHVNAGLWDLRIVAPGSPLRVVSLSAYRENIRNLITLTRQHTAAKIIWATITPILGDRVREAALQQSLAGRDAADVLVYNSAAVEVAHEMGVAIDDLHAVVMKEGPEKLICGDGVHFTGEAYRLLGCEVAACICGQL